MSNNGAGTVVTETKSVHEQYTDAHGDDSHLQIILSQESYDKLMALQTRAGERELAGNFDYWLDRAIAVGCQTIQRPWDDRDVVKLFADAKKGDPRAIKKLRAMFPTEA